MTGKRWAENKRFHQISNLQKVRELYQGSF